MTEFKTLSQAEEALNIEYVLETGNSEVTCDNIPPPRLIPEDVSLSPIFNCSPSQYTQPSQSRSVGDVVKEFLSFFKSSMSTRLKSQILNHLFKVTLVEDGGQEFFKFVQSDFLTSSVKAMETLYKGGKHNLMYSLSKCFEGPAPRMDLNRMPYGLLDYNIRFFACNRTQKLGMEEHYACWLETMFSQFGHKWLCLHRGPVWQYEVEPQAAVNVNVDQAHSSEVDIIQSALLQSSLSLEDSNDTLDLSNTTPSLMDIEPATTPTCSSPIGEEVSLEANVVEDVIHVSHLWNRVPESTRQEVEQGLVSPQEMESLHSIQPNSSATARRNPYMYDPLKVGDAQMYNY